MANWVRNRIVFREKERYKETANWVRNRVVVMEADGMKALKKMPNWMRWVRNRIWFDEADGMEAFKEKFVKDRVFSFNNVIEMPKSLNIETGSESHRALEVYLHSLGKKDADELAVKIGKDIAISDREYDQRYGKLSKEALKKYLELGKTQVDNYLKYGYTDRYGWCNANWGTMWDAVVVSADRLSITFDTAWDCPTPIIERIAKALKNYTFIYDYADVLIGNSCGTYNFQNGKQGLGTEMSGFRRGLELAHDLWLRLKLK